MATFKVNEKEPESIGFIQLSKEKTPIAYANKLEELMDDGTFASVEEAEKWLETTPIELEIYYQKNQGLFAVEVDAVDNGADIISPYDGEKLINGMESE